MKTVDGSLAIFDDGSEIFTPYNHDPKKNSPWVNLAICEGVTISATKNIVKVHLTFKRKPFRELSKTILSKVRAALVTLNTSDNKKHYEEMLKAADNIDDTNDIQENTNQEQHSPTEKESE